jgi:hypothetical protein
MTNGTKGLQQSALVMRILGWAMIALPLALPLYPPGFLWGSADFPALVPHPESHLHGLHPYLFMIVVLYVAWGILMVRGAKDPKANAALFDYGILANLFHALLMIPMAFIYPNEHAHLWADIPVLLAVCLILWIYHPNRVAPEASRA